MRNNMSQKQVTENKTEAKISVCDIMKNNTYWSSPIILEKTSWQFET